jgi:hypothetical protein
LANRGPHPGKARGLREKGNGSIFGIEGHSPKRYSFSDFCGGFSLREIRLDNHEIGLAAFAAYNTLVAKAL